MLNLDDTICAVASVAGGSARGIIRLSGPNVAVVLRVCFPSSHPPTIPSSLTAELQLAPPLPALPGDLLFWPDTRSYTRQPTAEFHTLGSPPLLAAAMRAFCAAGARPAEPGEFTLRAFLAGRLDLTQAEAVLGVIDAAGRSQLDVALTQLAGGFARPLAELRSTLLELLAHLEAGLDFVEEDIEFISRDATDAALGRACDTVERLINQMRSRSVANERPRVVLVGLPNAGKSSLFNALIGRAAAIVSHHPGTTRDYLTAEVEFDGLSCELIDTAGVDTQDVLHQIDADAQQRSTEQRDRAELVVECVDATNPRATNLSPHVRVLTKCDRAEILPDSCDGLPTSAITGQGLFELASKIKQALNDRVGDTAVAGTAERCHDSLQRAAAALAEARSLNVDGIGEELIAAELRLALDEIGRVVGAVYTDDLLDQIFSRFCIGK